MYLFAKAHVSTLTLQDKPLNSVWRLMSIAKLRGAHRGALHNESLLSVPMAARSVVLLADSFICKVLDKTKYG